MVTRQTKWIVSFYLFIFLIISFNFLNSKFKIFFPNLRQTPGESIVRNASRSFGNKSHERIVDSSNHFSPRSSTSGRNRRSHKNSGQANSTFNRQNTQSSLEQQTNPTSRVSASRRMFTYNSQAEQQNRLESRQRVRIAFRRTTFL